MLTPDAIGAVGVALLLVAFVLNLTGRLDHGARLYHLLNAAGAAISGYASFLIGFAPFVLLEAVWCMAALVALVRGRSPAAGHH